MPWAHCAVMYHAVYTVHPIHAQTAQRHHRHGRYLHILLPSRLSFCSKPLPFPLPRYIHNLQLQPSPLQPPGLSNPAQRGRNSLVWIIDPAASPPLLSSPLHSALFCSKQRKLVNSQGRCAIFHFLPFFAFLSFHTH